MYTFDKFKKYLTHLTELRVFLDQLRHLLNRGDVWTISEIYRTIEMSG